MVYAAYSTGRGSRHSSPFVARTRQFPAKVIEGARLEPGHRVRAAVSLDGLGWRPARENPGDAQTALGILAPKSTAFGNSEPNHSPRRASTL